MTNKIGQTIRNARTHKGLSQAELAAKAGVSQAAIGHWERGTFTPRGKNLKALSEILGIGWQPDLPLPELDEPDEPIPMSGTFFGQPGHPTKVVEDGKVGPDAKSRAAEFEHSLACALSHFDNTVRIGAQMGGPKHDSWKIDLMSDRTVIEVKHPSSYHRLDELIERALWRLAFLKAFFGDHLLYVAVIRRPTTPDSIAGTSPAHERLITKLAAEADLVGIHLILVDTPEEAAQAICDLEEARTHIE